MIPSKKRRDFLPRFLIQGVVVVVLVPLLLNTAQSEWISSRNGKTSVSSNLWYPNMPSSKILQQRSSSFSPSSRGGPPTPISHKRNSNSEPSPSQEAPSRRGGGPASKTVGHRSVGPHFHVGQPTYQTIHGGVINRQEYSRNSNNNNGPSSRSGGSRAPSQFSQRSGAPHWNGRNGPNPSAAPSPTIVTSKHLSINLSPINSQQQRNNKGGNNGNSHSWSGSQPSPLNTGHSRRLLEVGPPVHHVEGPHAAPTRRPITQIAGALQDSWPNSNIHHHLSPVMKQQQQQVQPMNRNYAQPEDEGGSSWGGMQAHVRVPERPIDVQTVSNDELAERKLAVAGGREKLVSNTLSTLAKLSPKKPIFVYMRVEGIGAIDAGAEAGDVIKKLAGGSKLPFYNGTKSLPKDNMPQVFLAPEDLPAPPNYGKIPIPNLRPKEVSTPKPTFTKILLPGGTKMTSHLSSPGKTTTTAAPTTVKPSPVASSSSIPVVVSPQLYPQVKSTTQPALYPSMVHYNATVEQPLSLEQRIQFLQMFQQEQQKLQYQQQQALQQKQIQQAIQQQQLQQQYQQQVQRQQQQQTIQHPQQQQIQQILQLQQPQQIPQQFQQAHQIPNLQHPVPPPTQFPQQHRPQNLNLPTQQQIQQQQLLQQQMQQLQQQQLQKQHQLQQFQQEQKLQQQQQLQRQQQQQQLQLQQQMQQQQQLLQQQQLKEQRPSPPPSPSPSPLHADILRGVLPKGAILESITSMGANGEEADADGASVNPYAHPAVLELSSNSIQQGAPSTPPQPEILGPSSDSVQNMFGSLIEKAVEQNIGALQQTARLGQPQSKEQVQSPYPQHPSQYQVQMVNGQPMLIPAQWPQQQQPQTQTQTQSKVDNFRQQRPPGVGPPPPNRNPLKNALSFLGIQSTPRSLVSGPTGSTTPRPFGLHPTSPAPMPPQGYYYSSTMASPTRAPPPLYHHHHHQHPPTHPPIMANRRDGTVGGGGSSVEKPGRTIIVQTPDASRANGEKSTFVIANGENNDLPDLKKIMKVLNELNGAGQQGGGPSTRQPIVYVPSPTPNPLPLAPTQRPTTYAPQFHSTGKPIQPQVVIRHPSGGNNPNPTVAPIVMSTGRPEQQRQQVVASTLGPSPTPRPQFVIGPSPSPVEVIKALSHSDFMKHQHPQQSGPKIIITNGNQPPPPPTVTSSGDIVRNIVSAIPGRVTNRPTPTPTLAPVPTKSHPHPTAVLPPGIKGIPPGTVPKIIEVDPNLSPEEIQKSIMESIMRHQQETNGGMSTGPIVINADPSMADALGNSPHFLNIQGSESSFTLQQQALSANATSAPSAPSTPSVEWKNHLSNLAGGGGRSKEHHHSKEVSDEKPQRNRQKDKSSEKHQDSSSSEEKVIEKVITEEKIVWNPGPGEGEMIPSRIKMEERIILKPHGGGGSKSGERKAEERSSSVEKESSSETTTKTAKKPSKFGLKLIHNKEEKEAAAEDKNDSSFDASNFAGILRSKLKFEKMKQKLYPKKVVVVAAAAATEDEEPNNPFSRFLNKSPSPAPTDVSTLAEALQTQPASTTSTASASASSVEPIISSTPSSENGRFKIRPGDVSHRVTESVGGTISPTGQPVLFQSTGSTATATATATATPSPSSFHSSSPTPSSFDVSPAGSYIGPSPSSFPMLQQVAPSAIPPSRNNEEKLFFIPAQSDSSPFPSFGGPTAQTMTDLMSQLSGNSNDNLNAQHFQQASPSNIPPPTVAPTASANRRFDNYDAPFTWRPNDPAPPSPTSFESLRQKLFPNGIGANVLHAVTAGFAANDPKPPAPPAWSNNVPQQPQPQLIYSMPNGVPLALNQDGGYQPIVIQGTKEPFLSYYGYNWGGPVPAPAPTPNPVEQSTGNQSNTEPPKYTSRFRGTLGEKESNLKDIIDPISEEYAEGLLAPKNKGKSNHKTSATDDLDEPQKSSSRRRRPPSDLKDNSRQEESVENGGESTKTQAVTPNVLSRRIDESEEHSSSTVSKTQKKKQVKVHKDMFVNSGEKKEDEAAAAVTPPAKLPILLAPSIISQKSVVSKTGSNYNDKTATKNSAPTSTTTTVVGKIGSSNPTNKATEEDTSQETQDELKALLKKLQQKLGTKDDVYELAEGYEYYDEVQVPATKPTSATTTTTTTTAKATKGKSSKKNNKSSKKKSKKSNKKSSKKKDKKKNKKSKKNKKKTTKKTVNTTTTHKSSSSSIIPEPTKASTFTSTVSHPPAQSLLKNHRHPASSIETFASSSASSAPVEAQPYKSSTLPSSTEKPSTKAPPTPAPSPPSNEPTTVAFIYPQNEDRDLMAAKTNFRRRPLWIRRKNSGELEPVAQPSDQNNGKVIRLVKRRRPVVRKPEPSTTTSTTTMPVDVLFETNNELLEKRVGNPDSSERGAGQGQGKRKLKLIRVKGQRAQWKLKMNDDLYQDAPFAEKLVAPPESQSSASAPVPPHSSVQSSNDAREGRQTSVKIEKTVCISGNCELVSKY